MSVLDDEEARAAAYRRARASRARATTQRETRLAGNPARAAQLDANWQPIRDAATDREAARHPGE